MEPPPRVPTTARLPVPEHLSDDRNCSSALPLHDDDDPLPPPSCDSFARTTLADVLKLATLGDARAKVAADRAFKELHHDAEERPRQRGVPPTLGRLVPDEGVLSLDLTERG